MTTSGIIFFSILFVLLLILSWLVCHDFSIDKNRWLIYILLTPFYALIAACMELIVVIIMLLCVYCEKVPDPSYQKDIPIYSIGINNSFNIEGNFVLGFGTAEGESYPVYRFYGINDNSEYHLNEVNAKNFNIVLTDTEEPHVHINTTKYLSTPKHCKWAFDAPISLEIKQRDWHGTIYLPSNSIIKSYEIKL